MLTRSVDTVFRGIIALVFMVHGIGKFQYPIAFQEKFDLEPWVVHTTAFIEVSAAAGLIVGAVFARHMFGAAVTWLSCLGLLIVQVGAIVVARFPRFLEYNAGAEYNLVLCISFIVIATNAYVFLKGRNNAGRV